MSTICFVLIIGLGPFHVLVRVNGILVGVALRQLAFFYAWCGAPIFGLLLYGLFGNYGILEDFFREISLIGCLQLLS